LVLPYLVTGIVIVTELTIFHGPNEHQDIVEIDDLPGRYLNEVQRHPGKIGRLPLLFSGWQMGPEHA
jgi:hypothetical protein